MHTDIVPLPPAKPLPRRADSVFTNADPYAPIAAKIKAVITRLTPWPAKWILTTHFHRDLTGGNEAFGSGASRGKQQMCAISRALTANPKRVLPRKKFKGDKSDTRRRRWTA